MTTYAQLVERGCLCGGESPAGPFECPLHGPGDNRGIAAFFKAGMPKAFPMAATCSLCGADALLYPNVDLEDPGTASVASAFPIDDGHKPTLVCPSCSVLAVERLLVAEVEATGRHSLNARRVFVAEPETEIAA